ncbi:MAG: T9SS type A sorting domain-containing protein [Sediminibacterium sp.]|nr:T9SS type A sorting domain-containing protein [Sediminibacterium sp.]
MKKTSNQKSHLLWPSVSALLLFLSILKAQSPYLVKDLFPGINSSMGGFPNTLTAVGNSVFFSAEVNATSGYELCYSNGTAIGTYLVKELTSAYNTLLQGPLNITALNDKVYFKALQNQLWQSDGTFAGTFNISQTNFSLSTQSAELISNANKLFFAGITSANGTELWGLGKNMPPGIIRDINRYPNDAHNSYPRSFINMNGITYFLAEFAELTQPNNVERFYGEELWRTDGTYSGTYMVKDICSAIGAPPGSRESSHITELTAVNGILYFSAYTNPNGYALWRSDGTSSGTYMVKDILPGGPQINESNPIHSLVNVNGTLFFAANDQIHGYELWKSDGTAQGTIMVKDINNGTASSHAFDINRISSYKELVAYNGNVYFWAHEGNSTYKLWKSDGTANGTTVLKEGLYISIQPFEHTSVVANGHLYFSAAVAGGDHVLYKTDGTTSGTVPLGGGRNPNLLCNANGIIYYAADDNQHGIELWALNTCSSLLITQQPYSRKVFRYNPASFSVQATGTSLTFKWFKNGQPYGGLSVTSSQGSTITIPSASINDVGDYSVEITDGCGKKVTSQMAKLSLNEPLYNLEVFAKLNTNDGVCNELDEPFALVAFDIYNNEGGSFLGHTNRTGSFTMPVYAGEYTVVPRDLGNGLVPIPAQLIYTFPSSAPSGNQFCFMYESVNSRINYTVHHQGYWEGKNGYVKVFPNPAKDVLHIEIHDADKSTTVTVYNILGEVVLRQDNISDAINLKGVLPGYYTIQILNENTKIVKQFIKE